MIVLREDNLASPIVIENFPNVSGIRSTAQKQHQVLLSQFPHSRIIPPLVVLWVMVSFPTLGIDSKDLTLG